MQINVLIKDAHENAVKHGFWEDIELCGDGVARLGYNKFFNEVSMDSSSINAIGNRLMLIVGEVSEAQEALRRNDTANFKEELADVAIRLADLCGGLGIDLDMEIRKKMDKNKNRPYKHGKSF